MSQSRSFLFDIGNVICSFDFTLMLSRLQAQGHAKTASPLSVIHSIKDAYETGTSTDSAFIAEAIKATDFTGSQDKFIRIWCDIFTENKQMTELIRSLAGQGHNLYLLSNTNRLHLDYLKRTYPAFAYFSGGIFSHEVGVMKPHEAIYRSALEKFSLTAEETLYIDDLPENINAGRLLNLKCHQYSPRKHQELIKWLSGQGI
jgi:putative hydrolase of the HAD superfamily